MGYGIKKTYTVTAATASGTLDLDLNGFRVSNLRAFINVTTATGDTPTLDVVVQDTLDDTNYNALFSFTQATAERTEVVNFITPFADKLRLDYTIGAVATPVFTFTVTIIGKD